MEAKRKQWEQDEGVVLWWWWFREAVDLKASPDLHPSEVAASPHLHLRLLSRAVMGHSWQHLLWSGGGEGFLLSIYMISSFQPELQHMS